MWILNWLTKLLSGNPHFIIGGQDDPYLLRWYLIPRNPLLNIYLHKFLRDDDDRALHDHPWWFLSVILKGSYFEWTEKRIHYRHRWSVAFRPATHRHRVELPLNLGMHGEKSGGKRPTWTLVITGRKCRVWGFWCPKGFVPWYDFVADDDKGSVGRGCDE